VLGGVISALAMPAVASANATNIESGRAYDLNVSALGINLQAGPDTGLISTVQSTTTTVNAGSLSSPFGSGSLLSATVITSKTEGASSEASIAKAHLTLPGLPVIDGKLLVSKSAATCRNHGTVLGSSVGGSLTVNGTTYPIASPPNTVIPLGLGTITINEQIKKGNSLQVNAIHVKAPLLGVDAVVASAFSGVSNCA
jgi:hypothetical protein